MRASVRRSAISAVIQSTDGRFAYAPDGLRMAVVRPRRPDVAMAVGEAALRNQDGSLLKDLPDDEYLFVGWLAADGKSVLDDRGNDLGAPQRGDSLVTFFNNQPPSIRRPS